VLAAATGRNRSIGLEQLRPDTVRDRVRNLLLQPPSSSCVPRLTPFLPPSLDHLPAGSQAPPSLRREDCRAQAQDDRRWPACRERPGRMVRRAHPAAVRHLADRARSDGRPLFGIRVEAGEVAGSGNGADEGEGSGRPPRIGEWPYRCGGGGGVGDLTVRRTLSALLSCTLSVPCKLPERVMRKVVWGATSFASTASRRDDDAPQRPLCPTRPSSSRPHRPSFPTP
jgi:hypothetical protein